MVNLEWGDPTVADLNKFTFIGKILTKKFLNKGAVKSLILINWNPKRHVSISELTECVLLFNFSEEEDYRRIVSDIPWTVLGHLLVLNRWSELITFDEINWSKTPLWVQFHGIPFKGMTENNLLKMSSKVGELLADEDPFLNDDVTRSFFANEDYC